MLSGWLLAACGRAVAVSRRLARGSFQARRRSLDGRTHHSSRISFSSFAPPVGRSNTYARARVPRAYAIRLPLFSRLQHPADAPGEACSQSVLTSARAHGFRTMVSPLGDLASDSLASHLGGASRRLRSRRPGGALTPVRVRNAAVGGTATRRRRRPLPHLYRNHTDVPLPN